MTQYSRDLKRHLASLFLNENINLGKKYVFDIKRISKDEYDHEYDLPPGGLCTTRVWWILC